MEFSSTEHFHLFKEINEYYIISINNYEKSDSEKNQIEYL